MNNILIKFARDYIKENLLILTLSQKKTFFRMYANKRYLKGQDINGVVDKIPENMLDLAMTQIKRTIDLNKRTGDIHESLQQS